MPLICEVIGCGVMASRFALSYIGVYCCMKATRAMPGLDPFTPSPLCMSWSAVQPMISTARATRAGRRLFASAHCPRLSVKIRSLTAAHARSGGAISGCVVSSMSSRISAMLGGHLLVATCFFTASPTAAPLSASNMLASRFT